MLGSWNCLSDDLQLAVTRRALLLATEAAAHQADLLAAEFEAGNLPDRGGSEALRLFAALLRSQTKAATDLVAAGFH